MANPTSEELDRKVETSKEGSNNFYCCFPPKGKLLETRFGRRRKMVEDLDMLVDLCGFDVTQLWEEDDLSRENFKKGYSLIMRGEFEEAKQFEESTNKHRANVMKIVLPFYKLMREMGYTYHELVS